MSTSPDDLMPEDDPTALAESMRMALLTLTRAREAYAVSIEDETRDKRIAEADEIMRDRLGDFAEVAADLITRALPFVEFHE